MMIAQQDSGEVDDEKKQQKQQSVLTKLQILQRKRHQIAKLNHNEVVKEKKTENLATKSSAKKAKLEEKLNYEKFKQNCELAGLNPIHESWKDKNINQLTANEREIYEDSDKIAPMPSLRAGFKYQKLVGGINFDKKVYEQKKDEQNYDFFPSINSEIPSRPKDNAEDVKNYVKSLNKQIEKRKSFKRKRLEDDNETYDSINKRSERFNRKLKHFYGSYTEELKNNIDRGTAL